MLPIEGSLSEILVEVSKRVERHLKVKTSWGGTVDFNSIEMKVYCGSDVFEGIRWGDNELLRQANSKIGQHVDCSFIPGKEVVQSHSDTADGLHPIVTLTIGSTRDLIFLKQERRDKWKKPAAHVTKFKLEHAKFLTN